MLYEGQRVFESITGHMNEEFRRSQNRVSIGRNSLFGKVCEEGIKLKRDEQEGDLIVYSVRKGAKA